MSTRVYEIVEFNAVEAEARLPEFAEILVDAVESEASVGFILPFTQAEAMVFWQDVVIAMAENRTILLAALSDDRVVGTVQLKIAVLPNQPHRVDIAKLLVHRQARRMGIARSLMQQAEIVAQRHDRTLLTLDTITGEPAEQLYVSLGYTRIGIIPGYAMFPSGSWGDTAIFYKQL